MDTWKMTPNKSLKERDALKRAPQLNRQALNEMDNLEKLFKENDWEGFFSASLKELNLARAQKDQKKVDLIFRLLRGAVFLLGHEYGESERKNGDSLR